jgi:hypothetical protein
MLFHNVSSSICPPSPSAQCSHIRSHSHGSFSCVGKLDTGSALGGGHTLSQQSGPCAARSPCIRKGRLHSHLIRTTCHCAASMDLCHGVPAWQHFAFLSSRNSHPQLFLYLGLWMHLRTPPEHINTSLLESLHTFRSGSGSDPRRT